MGLSAQVVLPGETLELTAGNLGDASLLPCLNVYNPAGSGQPGQ